MRPYPRLLPLTIALTIAAPWATSTAAQDTPAASELDRVMVIGSRFQQRTATDSPVPIDFLGAPELRKNGYTDLAKVLQANLPSFNSPHSSTPDGNTHVRVATLRGLAPDQTLVLVNGKRRHSSAWINTSGSSLGGGSVPVELNAIPATALEQAQVLRDGAAAQYGSDAIAGVINLVLRRDLGVSANATWGVTDKGDGETHEAAFNAGWPLGADGVVHITVHGRERGFTNRAQADTRQQYFGVDANGNLTPISNAYGSGTGAPPPGITFDPREATIERTSLWRFGDPELRERALFVNADKPVNVFGEGTEFYTFGGWNLSKAESAASFRRPGENNNVRSIYPDGFLPISLTESENRSLAAGLRNRQGRWNWDLSQTIGDNDISYRTRNTVNASLGNASPTEFYNGKYRYTQATTNLDLTTEFEIGLDAPLQLATGAEFRHERYQSSTGEPDSFRNGGVPVLDGPAAGTPTAPGAQASIGITPLSETARHRHSYALYLDSEAQFHPRWLVSAALRFEDYSDFGTTLNGKLSTRVSVTDALSARTSVSTGFRAPSLQQQHYAAIGSRTLFSLDPNVPPRIIIQGVMPVDTEAARVLGASPLDAEQSLHFAAGLSYERGGFAATLDAYRIEIDDRILLSTRFTGPEVVALLAGQGIDAEAGRYFTNAADTRTHGLDLTFRYAHDLAAAGRLTFSGGYNRNRTRVITEARAAVPGVIDTPIFERQEVVRIERGQPRDNLQLGVGWDVGRYALLLRTVRYGEIASLVYSNQSAAQVAAIPPGSSFTTEPTATAGAAAGNVDVLHLINPRWVTDLDLGIKLGEKVLLSMGANNLFNTYPTRTIASYAGFSGTDTNGVFPYSSLSPFPYSGRFYYTRISVQF